MGDHESLNVKELVSENRALYEELTQCKADKDFVWNLWKKLQSSQPDLGSAVSMIMAREKEKGEKKDQKILEILKMKDEKIKELKDAAQAAGEETQYNQTRYHDLLITNKELKQKLKDQEQRFSSKLAETREQNEYLSEVVHAHQIQKELHDDKVKESLDQMEQEKNDLKTHIASLESQVNKLSQERSNFAAVMETNADLDKRIKDLAGEMEGLTEKCSRLRKQHEDAVLELRLKESKIQEQEGILEQQYQDARLKESSISALKEQLRQAQVECSNTSQQISEQKKRILQLEAVHSEQERSLKARGQEHGREVATLQKLVSDLQSQCSWNQAVENQLRLEMDELKKNSATQLKVKDEVIRELKETVVGLHPGGLAGEENISSAMSKKGRFVGMGDEANEQIPSKDYVEEGNEGSLSRQSALKRTETIQRHPDIEVLPGKLSQYESRIEELKKLLELKESELVEIRRAHSQRQQRYRMLKENYQFLQEQLTTYDTDAKVGLKRQLPTRPDERELRHEDSDQIWKELAHYKAEYEALAKERHEVLEEIDVLRVQHARSVATMQELQVHLQEERAQKEELLGEFSREKEQIKVLELDIDKMESDLASWQDQTLNCQRVVQELEEEKELVEQERRAEREENKALKREFSKLADEFEQLKSEQNLQKLKQQQQQQQERQERRETRLANVLEKSLLDEGLGDPQTGKHRVQQQVKNINKYEEQVRRVADKIMGSGSSSEVKQASLPRQASFGTQTEEITRTADFGVSVNMGEQGDLSATDNEDKSDGEPGTRARSRQGRVAGFKKPTAQQTPLTRKSQGLKRTPGRNEWASMKQRILSLTQEVSALRQTKEKAVKELNQQQEANESLQAEFNVMLQKMQVSRNSVQHLTDSLKKCQEEKESFVAQLAERSEKRVNAVSVADWKRLEEQLTAASRECIRLSHIVRSFTAENEDLKAKLKEAQQKLTRTEHALNQKRTLVDELKGKAKEARDKGAESSEQVKGLEEKVAEMKEREKATKVRIGTLERRQQTEAKEKSKYRQELLKYQKELRKKTHLLSKTQALRSQAEVVVSEMETAAAIQLQGLANQSEAAMTSLRCKLDKVTERVEEYQAFVKTLLEDMLNTTRRAEESLDLHQEQQWRNASKSSVKKAQKKARDILDISSSDLEEILQDDGALHAQQWNLREKTWWSRLEAALRRENAFAVPLLELLLDAIEERVSAESKLRALSQTSKE